MSSASTPRLLDVDVTNLLRSTTKRDVISCEVTESTTTQYDYYTLTIRMPNHQRNHFRRAHPTLLCGEKGTGVSLGPEKVGRQFHEELIADLKRKLIFFGDSNLHGITHDDQGDTGDAGRQTHRPEQERSS